MYKRTKKKRARKKNIFRIATAEKEKRPVKRIVKFYVNEIFK